MNKVSIEFRNRVLAYVDQAVCGEFDRIGELPNVDPNFDWVKRCEAVMEGMRQDGWSPADIAPHVESLMAEMAFTVGSSKLTKH